MTNAFDPLPPLTPEQQERYIGPAALRRWARDEVAAAIARGELDRPDVCSECGSPGRIEAHHDDYNAPLAVRWLCHDCHQAHHEWQRSTS